jgi:hypothetical protein
MWVEEHEAEFSVYLAVTARDVTSAVTARLSVACLSGSFDKITAAPPLVKRIQMLPLSPLNTLLTLSVHSV